MPRSKLFLVPLLLVAALGASCGGGAVEQAATPTVSAPAPSPRPTSALPTMEPNVSLVDYESPGGLFAVKYPAGWRVDSWGVAGAGAVFTWQSGPIPFARVTISCTHTTGEITYDDLLAQDAAMLGRFGNIASAPPVDVEVGGVTGQRLRFFTNAQGVYVEQDMVYALVGDCAWRLQLQSWGEGTIDQYTGLFEEMVASFRPG